MAYTINTYNNTPVASVADGTIDTTLDIKLIGKNYSGYGEAQNENFVYLLENFAGTTPPPNRIKGQIWFDSGSKKLKFYDGLSFRTTGGAEVAPVTAPPSGLTQGDFWWDTSNQQLKAWDGNAFVLIGPQTKASSTTEMRSMEVVATTQTGGATHQVIAAYVGNDVAFIVSKDAMFELAQASQITGFGKIQQGITLRNTTDDTQLGQTTTAHRFWGTATNADRLGGYLPSDFIRAASARFTQLVNFADVGYTVGYPNERLKVYNDGQLTPTFFNQLNSQIVFKTTVVSTLDNVTKLTKTPLILNGVDVIPGENNVSKLGDDSHKFTTVYASTFSGVATQADSLSVSGSYKTASTTATSGTIAARTSVEETVDGVTISPGSIKATFFHGTATKAYYADLAEKYLADAEYEIGTVVVVGGEKEVTESTLGKRALGAVSGNPAYMMNSGLIDGTFIALKGRVPVKIIGAVKKGDLLVASNNGCAQVALTSTDSLIFGIALESNDDINVKLVESVIL
jgi:hypothetical protein